MIGGSYNYYRALWKDQVDFFVVKGNVVGISHR